MTIMMSQEATRALIDWSPINERIIKATMRQPMMQMSKQKKTSTENYKK